MLSNKPALKPGAKTTSFCHVQIKKTAIGLCEQNYDELMSDNMVYEIWRKKHPGKPDRFLRKAFVDKNWGRYIPAARTTLALLLRTPIDEALKLEIVEVLALDAQLIPGRLNPTVVTGQITDRK